MREELLDAKGQFAERMYDRLAAEVKEAADEAFEERAAIFEFDGGLSRREAEAAAAFWLAYGKWKGGRKWCVYDGS